MLTSEYELEINKIQLRQRHASNLKKLFKSTLMDLNYLFQIEEGGYIRLPRKLVDLILDHITSRPCGFAIHRESNCGSATRADNISAFSDSGITNPRGQKDKTKNSEDKLTTMFSTKKWADT